MLSQANAANLVPDDLVGVWATEGSKFSKELLITGQALYIDTDGVGVSLGADGKNLAGTRVVVTSYSKVTNILQFDITESGKVIGGASLKYDPGQKVIFSPKDQKQIYSRIFTGMTPELRKSLKIEAKSK